MAETKKEELPVAHVILRSPPRLRPFGAKPDIGQAPGLPTASTRIAWNQSDVETHTAVETEAPRDIRLERAKARIEKQQVVSLSWWKRLFRRKNR